MKRIGVIAVFLVLCCSSDIYACTIIKLTHDGRTIIGNNEDWSDPASKVWLIAPEPGKYGRILFGFENGWAQGGMNDQGLFFDGVAGDVRKWTSDPDIEVYPGNLCEKILEQASTVDQAASFFRLYNFPSLTSGIFVFVDKSGKVAQVQYADGQVDIKFFNDPVYAYGYKGDRAKNELSRVGKPEIDRIAKILKKCERTDQFPTQYSNIYDPQNLIVTVNTRTGNKEPIVFDLHSEWEKGSHYYNLPKYPSQIDTPLLRDHKTTSAINLTSDQLGAYGLDYSMRSSKIDLFLSGNRLMMNTDLIFDGVMSFRLIPVSEDRFYVRDLNVDVWFERKRSGTINELHLKYGRKEYVAKPR